MTETGPIAGWPPPLVTECRCGRSHAVGTRTALVAPGALDTIADLLEVPAASRGPLLLLSDPDTRDAAGSRVATRLRAVGRDVREVVLEGAPRADDSTIERLRPELGCAPARIVAVGAGTIGDLGKTLAAEAGIPLATVGTAASMNGYTSSIVALTVGGLKVTRPAPAPDILVLDTDVLAAAPLRLTRAGFGDLCSKPVSGADWLLAHVLLGESICPAALSVADEAVQRARARAEAIGRADREAVTVLAEALVVSGLSMTIAGVSSPASGGEHLISHYLDMSAKGWNHEPRLHGEQVAVGTRVGLAIYRRLREAGPPDLDAVMPAEESREELERLHAHLPPDAFASVIVEATAKATNPPVRAQRRRRLAEAWTSLWQRLDTQLAAGNGIEDDLAAAGVPCTFPEIDVDPDRAATVIRIARHMRNRTTMLDVAADLGYLNRWAEEIAGELKGKSRAHP